jgi:hypothetical protein
VFSRSKLHRLFASGRNGCSGRSSGRCLVGSASCQRLARSRPEGVIQSLDVRPGLQLRKGGSRHWSTQTGLELMRRVRFIDEAIHVCASLYPRFSGAAASERPAGTSADAPRSKTCAALTRSGSGFGSRFEETGTGVSSDETAAADEVRHLLEHVESLTAMDPRA